MSQLLDLEIDLLYYIYIKRNSCPISLLVNLPLVMCNRSTKQIKLKIFCPAMTVPVSAGLYPLICLLWTFCLERLL